MSKNPTKKNTLPFPLHGLSAKDITFLTGLPLDRCQKFIEGEFRPNKHDHKKIVAIIVPFYLMHEGERLHFILRKKYRAIKRLVSLKEKDDLLISPEEYARKLDLLVDKYWDQIFEKVAMRE